MANTGFDEHIMREEFVGGVFYASNDGICKFLHEAKFFGEGYYTVPIFAVTAIAEPLIADLPLGSKTAEWGQRSLRSVMVGTPPMLILQNVTGAGRPGETNESSKWRPFQDDNGVSGHSFMGAIPFISAAKMTDNPWYKAGLYGLSVLPAISRVSDDRHYTSQAFLGWWLAYLAGSAVDRTHNPNSHLRFFFYPQPSGMEAGLEYRR